MEQSAIEIFIQNNFEMDVLLHRVPDKKKKVELYTLAGYLKLTSQELEVYFDNLTRSDAKFNPLDGSPLDRSKIPGIVQVQLEGRYVQVAGERGYKTPKFSNKDGHVLSPHEQFTKTLGSVIKQNRLKWGSEGAIILNNDYSGQVNKLAIPKQQLKKMV